MFSILLDDTNVLASPPVPALAEQKCSVDSHGIRRYNGKPCASTTRYDDGHRGACGCGPANSDNPYTWNLADYVTAPNQKFFDDGGMNTWCGSNCGVCVKLTPTDQPNTHGYEVHFDLQNNKGQVSNGLGWDNPECTWERVACPSYLSSYYKQCECF
ncbi:hypothetical protein EGW08_019240 [Elysia chlorotica]|uniref:Expansin-like EG45 domain-containing protein n=1 Tax=Elysia chlorotica TaxID=188477 RepID=A0A433SUP9_ELYCH|nr:hypothetical protein EGW08_019240 [Elysia chlorotica]